MFRCFLVFCFVTALLNSSAFIIYGCTQKVVLKSQSQSEQEKITEMDSAGNFISAEYCFHLEFDIYDGIWKWDFSPYKINNPLNLKLPEICEHGYSYSFRVDSKDSFYSLTLPRSGGMGGIGTSTGKQRKIRNDYKSPVEEIFNVYPICINYKEIGIPLLQKEDTVKILNLAGKSFPIKWKLKFSCKGDDILDLQGTYYIRISGICTEKQLKIIEYGESNE